MKHCRHITASILVLLAYLYSIPASATNYQDWWWNPAQSGQGVNIGQQDNTLFASWFTYDQNGTGIFLVMAGPVINNKVTGDLIRTVGPALGTPFNPDLVVETVVGTATLTFSDANNATLQSTVNGISGTLALTRFTFASIPISGTYYGAGVGTISGCTNPANNRDSTAFGTLTVTGNGSTININTYSVADIAGTIVTNVCTSTGTYSQAGSVLQASTITSCSDGTARTGSEEIRVTEDSLVYKSTGQVTFGETCRIVGRFAGVRQ